MQNIFYFLNIIISEGDNDDIKITRPHMHFKNNEC